MSNAAAIMTSPAGAECPPPGIYYNVPAHIYHQWPAISSTLLKGYAENPSTCRTPYVPKDDAHVGTGIHAYTLQGDAGLQAECVILPAECEGTSKKAKEEREIYSIRHPHLALLPHRYGPGAAETKTPIMDVLKSVDASFMAHPKCREVLENSEREVSLVWIDQRTGCTCKARLDVLCFPFFFDVKKTLDLDKFPWQIRSLHYDIQLGHYRNGAIANGIMIAGAGFLPCEAYPPFRVDCGYLDPDKLIAASLEAERLITLVKQSQITGNWPNYKIPPHIWDLNDIKPDDLMQVW